MATFHHSFSGDLDLVVEILSLLPVKSVIRFNCVCKTWNNLIKTSSFITLHLKNATSKKEKSIMLKYGRLTNSIGENLISILSNDTLEVCRNVKLPMFNDKGHNMGLLIYGPCNGIFCLYGYHRNRDDEGHINGDDIALWNPATREIKPLPVAPFPRPRGNIRYFVNVGFGFDPKSNDYKVVKMLHFTDYSSRSTQIFDPQVEVYSFNTDSWKQINNANVPPVDCMDSSHYMTCLNGVQYWYWYEGFDTILSFDMHDEVFREIPIPPNIIGKPDRKFFGVTNDSLTFIVSYYQGFNYKWFDIWVSNDEDKGMNITRNKQLRIGPLNHSDYVLGFWRNGNVFIDHAHGKLALYNPGAQEIKSLHVSGFGSTLCLAIYTESLVSINGKNELVDREIS